MKRTVFVILVLAVTALLLFGCAKEAEPATPIVLSESFSAAAPETTQEPAPAPDKTDVDAPLTEYTLGDAVLTLPEGLEADVSYDGSFFITGSAFIISGAWYDADYFSYMGLDYPDSVEAAADALIPAECDVLSVDQKNGHTVIEYIEWGETTRWANYAVFVYNETVCWKVAFICPESSYEELRPSFAAWSEDMTLPETVESHGTYNMMSSSGLFTLDLPSTCIVIDETTTAETLSLYGLDEEEARSMLDEIRERADGQDVICRADFGAVLTVTVDPYAYMTQSQMPDMEDELYIDGSIGEGEYTYEGIVLVGDNPNAFYFVRIERDGQDELGYTTYHDDTGASITFSFAGFSEEEAQEILETLEMVGRSE